MTLRDVKHFRVPQSAIKKTEEAIRRAGERGFELFVIWSGLHDKDVFVVTNAHVPRQSSYKHSDGLCVRVDGPELHRLNVWLFESRQMIGAQVHSHPTDAYHSETDDAYAIATLDGSLSIVLPYFGREGFTSNEIAAYRLDCGTWLEVTDTLPDLIEVIQDAAC